VNEFKDVVALHIDVLNSALKACCQSVQVAPVLGNYEGPHHHDVPLQEIIHLVFKARPEGISFEGANPRHAHEWKVWRDVRLPDDKVIIPGVLTAPLISLSTLS
jgi:5-methyltetrahydropteroyltriglutamate--homocysteine methyltransferase